MGQQGSTESHATKDVPDTGTMKAWVMEARGGVDALSPKDNISIPEPGVGQVRIKVMAASVSMEDVRRLSAERMPYPAAMGLDGAGVIELLGPNTPSPLPVGARVYFTHDTAKANGSLAEFTVLNVSDLHIMQPSVSFTTAASLPSSAWGAYVAVFEKLNVKKGKTIFITGGAGGLAGFAADMCKASGLTVVTTCSSYNVEYVKTRGADHVFDYTDDDVGQSINKVTDGRGVDYVLDTVSSESAAQCLGYLAQNGQICVANGHIEHSPDISQKGLSVHCLNLGGMIASEHLRAEVGSIADSVMHMASEGRLQTHVGEVGKWEFVREALKTVASRHVQGKLVINVEPLHIRRQRLAAQREEQAAEYRVLDDPTQLAELLKGSDKLEGSENVLATAGQVVKAVEREGDVVRVAHKDIHCWLPAAALTKVHHTTNYCDYTSKISTKTQIEKVQEAEVQPTADSPTEAAQPPDAIPAAVPQEQQAATPAPQTAPAVRQEETAVAANPVAAAAPAPPLSVATTQAVLHTDLALTTPEAQQQQRGLPSISQYSFPPPPSAQPVVEDAMRRSHQTPSPVVGAGVAAPAGGRYQLYGAQNQQPQAAPQQPQQPAAPRPVKVSPPHPP